MKLFINGANSSNFLDVQLNKGNIGSCITPVYHNFYYEFPYILFFASLVTFLSINASNKKFWKSWKNQIETLFLSEKHVYKSKCFFQTKSDKLDISLRYRKKNYIVEKKLFLLANFRFVAATVLCLKTLRNRKFYIIIFVLFYCCLVSLRGFYWQMFFKNFKMTRKTLQSRTLHSNKFGTNHAISKSFSNLLIEVKNQKTFHLHGGISNILEEHYYYFNKWTQNLFFFTILATQGMLHKYFVLLLKIDYK